MSSLSPNGEPMEWDSKSRSEARRIGPAIISKASLKYQHAHNYLWEAINSGAITRDVGLKALQELNNGNYNICTVGTGNAYDGFFEAFRKGVSTGRRR